MSSLYLFGMHIKEWRASKRMSQMAFAAAVEDAGQRIFGDKYTCEAPMVSRWELGKNVPAGHHLLAVLMATGGSIEPRPGKISLVELVQNKTGP
jgi:DNA-binding transcriptional regulator YiaG